MPTLPWTPWRDAIKVRPDLLSGELSLSMFAADLYSVIMRRTDTVAAIYTDPATFFGLTYPTYAMRELVKEVAQRLAGKSDKAVRQLALTYGGGKTHTLITLYHLFNGESQLPSLPTVDEFRHAIGMALPRTRVAVISFDNLDPEKGMEVRDPAGNQRWLRYPWSVLAYQLAGDEGLELIGSAQRNGENYVVEERETPPFANIMRDLLALPASQGLSVLLLLDEVLMWARMMSDHSAEWTEKTKSFFQFLSQATVQVKTCAMVVSLLASDPRRYDERGRAIASDISAVLERQKEENLQPVGKDDVAEILRRRLFDPESILNRSSWASHTLAALEGIKGLDEGMQKGGPQAEARYRDSYPFHPDLTDLFYSKWTNLENFQRTRGVLRTYALALRDSVQWDDAPLIATNVFLNNPGQSGLSPAARALAEIARTETLEGAQQSWPNILEGELDKACTVQQSYPGLRYREVEQAVFATFLHSQPVGMNAKAQTHELMTLVGSTRPDKIELVMALQAWADGSWFLDDSEGEDRTIWRLGLKPNLNQMHHDAVVRVAADPGYYPDRREKVQQGFTTSG